ncbi:hypothetical protein G167_gp56 [Burkholderia phage BcepMigl]|uniref:Uncharacterized protein n=1 Tax=Burkholderia phage BcepMigl TaxID=2886899 RepID=I6WLN4_9CAUD|nr:hypothetical protein G167_gp56 [Burkholderia phage BcepMigl]AFN39098.1 hypothetical protein BcepMigl_gp29 [Burkholderia phage BcepMigl]
MQATAIYRVTFHDGCWINAELSADHATAIDQAKYEFGMKTADGGDDVSTVEPLAADHPASIRHAQTSAEVREVAERAERDALIRDARLRTEALRHATARYRQSNGVRLTGPRGTWGGGLVCARSQFQRFTNAAGRTGWRWIAFDATDRVQHVIEMPDTLESVCDTANGALWALRSIAADHFHDVRSHRGH